MAALRHQPFEVYVTVVRDMRELAAYAADGLAAAGSAARMGSSCSGVGLFAARDLAAGERILLERPLVLTPCWVAREFVCATCLTASPNGRPWPLPCPGCKTLHFCSAACFEAAVETHAPCECASLATWRAGGHTNEWVADLILQAVRILSLRASGTKVRLASPSARLHLRLALVFPNRCLFS